MNIIKEILLAAIPALFILITIYLFLSPIAGA
jgi:hypothetical protein